MYACTIGARMGFAYGTIVWACYFAVAVGGECPRPQVASLAPPQVAAFTVSLVEAVGATRDEPSFRVFHGGHRRETWFH